MAIVFQIDYPDAGQHSSRRTMNYDPIAALRPELYLKSNRSSHSSDTSSAYSGSDTMHSVQSSLDAEEVDLSGLVESVVDSDEDEDLAESIDVSFSCLMFGPAESMYFLFVSRRRSNFLPMAGVVIFFHIYTNTHFIWVVQRKCTEFYSKSRLIRPLGINKYNSGR
jgi:hypothetical protein